MCKVKAADAKRPFERERNALRSAKLDVHNDTQPSSAPQQQHQVGTLLLLASAGIISVLHKSLNSLNVVQSHIFPCEQDMYRHNCADIGNSPEHQSWQQQKAADAQQPRSAPKQPEVRRNPGQDCSRPVDDVDSAKDLASLPQGNDSPTDQGRQAQPQFMAGLMGLHGVTTPEEKRRREDKQTQYARELDEQVSTCETISN